MRKNMGTMDRMIRLLLAAAIAGLYFTGNLSGLAAIILGILAVVFIATSFVGSCPLYLPFGLSTRKDAP
jgi:K+-transporting ATPase A subunit